MSTSKEIRVRAWNSLKGKYWNAFLAVIVLLVVISVTQSVVDGITAATKSTAVATILSVAYFLFVQFPIELGTSKFFIVNTYEKPAIALLFSGFNKHLAKNALIYLWATIKVFLWALLFVIPGIIKAFEYAMIPYILAENPEITSKEAFELSKKMMTGNKWRYFVLSFSFIGWVLLAMLTFGIGALFLAPYIDAALAEFYVEVKNQ